MRTYYTTLEEKQNTADSLEILFKDKLPEQVIETCMEQVIKALNLDIESDSLRETPFRIAKMFHKELFSSIDRAPNVSLTSFKSDYSHYVSLTGIPYYSMCSHHFMPFFGEVNIAYFPATEDSKVLGISKFPRLVKFFSRKPQVQEDFTKEIADYIFKTIKPKGVMVKVTGYHTCVAARGAEVDAKVTTQAMLGNIDKSEVMELWKDK